MTDVSNQGNSQQQGQATTDVDFVALRPGQTIGRYEIVSVLGQGGFGITYRARDSQLGRDVAVKEYLPSALAVRQDGITVLPRSTKVADDFTWGRERFVAEGRTLASLEHAPAIVQVFDFLEANGTAYIVMKLVPGETLESRIKKAKLSPPEVDRILWPMLEGLEKVHAAGFLHRDIKPANVLLDAAGNPTLIDFGASRAAMAGRTTAMTAIFTPGYAAAEQMTSAKQGPWTDIYGIAATIYHAVTGSAPPSAFDRMLEDECVPLARLAPEGFSPGLLVGIDAGLAVKATDRPQTIAGWRTILGQTSAVEAQATIALTRSAGSPTTAAGSPGPPALTPRSPTIEPPPASAAGAPVASSTAALIPKRGAGPWIGLAAAVVLAAGGGGYYYATRPAGPDPAIEAARQQQAAADAEIAKLRQEKADRDRAEAEAALRRTVEEETRQKVAAEEVELKRQAEEARRKATEEAQAQRKAEDEVRRMAEQAEVALHHTLLNRQHVQVALNSLGFSPGPIDGVFTPRTREAIAAWQRARNFRVTGYLDGPQHQALMREGASAVAKFDEDQRKAEAEKKAAAEAAARVDATRGLSAPSAPPSVTGQQSAAAVPGRPAVPMASDGLWHGTYHCTPSRGGVEFTLQVRINVMQGVGTWSRNGQGPGNQSLTMRFNGTNVLFQRVFSIVGQPNNFSTGTFNARFDGTTVTGSGPEQNSSGRICDISFTR